MFILLVEGFVHQREELVAAWCRIRSCEEGDWGVDTKENDSSEDSEKDYVMTVVEGEKSDVSAECITDDLALWPV